MRPLVALLAAATLGGAHTVAAQTTPAPAGSFVLSAGTDVLGRDFGDATPGIAAHAGYERRIGGVGSPSTGMVTVRSEPSRRTRVLRKTRRRAA